MTPLQAARLIAGLAPRAQGHEPLPPISLAVLLALLAFYFRRFYGVVMPFTGAVVSAIWGLGFTALMGYQLEPIVLVIPMLITARAVSHSVQFVERFYEE